MKGLNKKRMVKYVKPKLIFVTEKAEVKKYVIELLQVLRSRTLVKI